MVRLKAHPTYLWWGRRDGGLHPPYACPCRITDPPARDKAIGRRASPGRPGHGDLAGLDALRRNNADLGSIKRCCLSVGSPYRGPTLRGLVR